MVAASQTAILLAEIDQVTSECHRALQTLRVWSGSSGSSSGNFTKPELKYFQAQIKSHRRNLLRVAAIPAKAQTKKQALARKLVWASLAAHTCAVIRAAVKRGSYLSPDQIKAGAINGKKWPVLNETITVWWKPKSSGGYRLMTKDGVF